MHMENNLDAALPGLLASLKSSSVNDGAGLGDAATRHARRGREGCLLKFLKSLL